MERIYEMTEELERRFKEICAGLESKCAVLPKTIAWPAGVHIDPKHFHSGTTDRSIVITEWRLVLGVDGVAYAQGRLGIWIEYATTEQRDALTTAATIRLDATIPVGPMAPRGVLKHIVDYDEVANSSGPNIRWGTQEESRAALLALQDEIRRDLDALG